MIVTAAVLAVGAAAAAAIGTAGFVAAAAAAVVAVSAAVGVVGLAVSVVGMATGNEDLLKAGEIMGYIGLAGAAAGGIIGGIGGMMQGGAGFMKGAAGAYTGAAEKMGEASGKYASFFDDAAGAKVMGPVENANPNFTQAKGGSPGVGEFPQTGVRPSTDHVFAGPGGGARPGAAIAPTPQAAPPPTAPGGPLAPQGPAAPGAPTVGSYADEVVSRVGTNVGGDAAANAAKTWADMPDWMKYSAMTAGLQGIAGMAGGYFQGKSAEEQLELEKLINAQRQGQVQYLNKNNQYAPRLEFNRPNGLIAQGA